MAPHLPSLSCLLILLTMSACATYAQFTGDLQKDLARGDYEAALGTLNDADSGANRLLFLMENGLVAHDRGHYEQSNTYFEHAERLADQLFTRSLSREVAALLTNDAVRAYRGEKYELVFIHYYRALNYWHLGLPEDALVECRKANLKLARHTSNGDYETSYRNDAFIHYMTGLFYEATGELNDAYVSYRDAAKAYIIYSENLGISPPALLYEDLRRVSGIFDSEDAPAVQLASLGTPFLPRPAGDGELVLFAETGFVPRKIQKEIDLPIFDDDIRKGKSGDITAVSEQIAWRYHRPYRSAKVEYWLRVALPVYQDTHPRVASVSLSASGKSMRAVPAENLALIARSTFQDKQPVIIARTVARGFAKYLATEGVKKKNKVLGFFANLLAASTEAADTRSWVSLPHAIHIGKLRLPPGVHDITVESRDASGYIIEQKVIEGVRILPGERTFLNVRSYK